MSKQVLKSKVTTKGNVYQKVRDTETNETTYRKIDPGTGDVENVIQQSYAAAAGWHRPIPRVTERNVDDINPDKVPPVTDVAYKDNKGNWHVGTDIDEIRSLYPELQRGDFISSETAQDLRSFRREIQAFSQVYRNLNRGDSQATKKEALEVYKETVTKIQKAETKEERQRIRRENFYTRQQHATPA